MFGNGTLTLSERTYLKTLYEQVELETPQSISKAMEWLRAASTALAAKIEYPVDDSIQQIFVSTDRQFVGGTTMADEPSPPVSYAAHLFSKTARLLAHNLFSLTEHHAEWPHLIIGDDVTQQSIDSLRAMQTQMGFISNLLEEFTPPKTLLRYQMERNSFMDSSRELMNLFEELDGYLASGEVPTEIAAEMERHLDDLLYYANRCLLWLHDLTRLAEKTVASSA